MPRNKFHKKSHRKKRTKRTKQIKTKAGINKLSNKDFFIKIGEKVKESNKSNEILKKINPLIKILSILKPQYLDILVDKLRENSEKPDLYIQNILNDKKQSNQSGGGEDVMEEVGVEEFSQVMLFLIVVGVYFYNRVNRNRTLLEILSDIADIADIVTLD